MVCPHCASNSAQKNGFSLKQVQRYRCTACLRTFTAVIDTRRVPAKLQALIHKLAAEGKSIRQIARQTGYGRSAIWNSLRRAGS